MVKWEIYLFKMLIFYNKVLKLSKKGLIRNWFQKKFKPKRLNSKWFRHKWLFQMILTPVQIIKVNLLLKIHIVEETQKSTLIHQKKT